MNISVSESANASSAICDLRNYVRYYDGALSREFCAQLVDNFEKAAHLQVPHGKGHQPGLDLSGWTELNVGRVADAAFLGFFHAQIDKYLAEYNRAARPIAADTAERQARRTAHQALSRR